MTSAASRMAGADLLVDAIVRAGVDTMFGVPGDTGIGFYDALSRRRTDIRHIMARDERHAGYMADGYARSSQRLAACEASSGAGAVYLASGLAESYGSSIPVLVITTDIPRRSQGSGAVTEIDQLALFGAVTKWCRIVESAADIEESVAAAVRAATSGRPGPAALILPEDVLDEHGLAEGLGRTPASGNAGVLADTAAVKAFARALATAERPAILAGGGVHMSRAWQALRSLAEQGAIPVATTIHGKGALPEDHPLSLGIAGGNGCRGYANDYLRECDALLVVGARANATDTYGFRAAPPAGRVVAQIDVDASRAGHNFPDSVGLVGDAAAVLDQIRAHLPSASTEALAARQTGIRLSRHAWSDRESAELPSPGDGRIQPREVIRLLHRTFGASTWVVADAGTPTPYLAAHWESAGEGWRVIIPRGHGPMGYAISSAIGVAIAHPGERVVCVTTESSLAMGVGDWETACRLSLPITYVVLDNVSMAWIKMLQHLYLDRRYFGVDPGPIDPVLLARGMGMRAELASDLHQLELLVKRELTADRPAAIHVRIPEHMDAPPPVAAWQAVLSGATVQRPSY